MRIPSIKPFKFMQPLTANLTVNHCAIPKKIYSQRRFYSDGPAPLTPKFVYERITSVLSNCDKIDVAKITPSARLEEDLGLDSLDVVDALFFIEEEFTVQMPDNEANELKTVQDIVEWVCKQHDAF